jgi:hypothetical protein
MSPGLLIKMPNPVYEKGGIVGTIKTNENQKEASRENRNPINLNSHSRMVMWYY